MADRIQTQIFLSHAGGDHKEATMLAEQLEGALKVQGYNVEVFNTSEAEHRFKDLREILKPGELWESKAKQWDHELREYLENNIFHSAGYVLLITQNSANKNSEWIMFEIEVARQAAEKRGLFFFTCLADGADFVDLPEGAKYFQSVDLKNANGFTMLVSALVQALTAGNRKR